MLESVPTPVPSLTADPLPEPQSGFERPLDATPDTGQADIGTTTTDTPSPPPDFEPEEEPALSGPRTTFFAHWLRPGALNGRARYQSGNGPALWIDFAQRQYFGPPGLKVLSEYFVAPVGLRDFEDVDERAWQHETAQLGAAQPLSRLQWFGGLLAGEGRLLSGYDPGGRYLLNKWPQTEREFPRHFRIATAMMKGPATLGEIAAASGVPETDIADFVNANLATGFAEAVSDAPASAEPARPTKPGSLFDRFRGR